ncbi:MAG: hypothetical protein K0Q71_1860 [Thermomicrobiales bacterium]|jgi:hypothetical protein|nr:hypothetical protein [Thermomicrobiales bacterium]
MSEQRNGQQHLFDGLIATYRELNLKVRPMPEDRLTIGRSGQTVRDVIVDLRDDELRFSQALKDRLTGSTMIDVFKDEEGTAKAEIPSSGDTTVAVLSQFGTARESTLAMLQGLAPEDWDDGSNGPLTIRMASDALLANDRSHMERIVSLLGSPTG